MARERRQFTRITLKVPTILSLYQVEAYHTGSIANISMGGCYFVVGDDLPSGEKCQLSITVGEGLKTETVVLSGQVVRSNPAGVGIEFTDISPEQKQQLEKIIAHCTSW